MAVSSLEMQRRVIQTEVQYRIFHSVLKEMTHRCSKSSAQNEISCYRYNLFQWMFFIPFDNWKSLFFAKVCCYLEIFSATIIAFFEAIALKEVHILSYFHKSLLITLNILCISESCIEIKIKLNFYFHTSLWCLKRFLEGP